MDIKLKSSRSDAFICEVPAVGSAGLEVNVSELFSSFREYLTDYEFEYMLGRIGLAYAIMAIESNYMDADQKAASEDLQFLELIMQTFNKAVRKPNLRKELSTIKVRYEDEISILKDEINRLKESIKSIRH